MQYLIKFTLRDTEAWRVIALDGAADRAHIALLVATAFGYDFKAPAELVVGADTLSAGVGGDPQNPDDLSPFDSAGLTAGDEFVFNYGGLVHEARIMKAEDKLWCMMPGCLIGSGVIAGEERTLAQIQAGLDAREGENLDLKAINTAFRGIGPVRPDVRSRLNEVSARDLHFVVQ